YYKPSLKWVIDKIVVCNPIAFTNIRRNEVKSKLSASNAKSAMNGTGAFRPLYTAEDIQQRASMVLRDVRYIITAHFEMTAKAGETDTVEKHYNIALRRLRTGQFFHQPYFGCREFPVNFRLFEGDANLEGLHESRDLGFMLYDLNYSNPRDIRPLFFRAVMTDGVIDLTNCEVVS
ncbi:MAG: type I-C CRISPR-associated protein Cas5c, partial [Ethanoligenens sp.]